MLVKRLTHCIYVRANMSLAAMADKANLRILLLVSVLVDGVIAVCDSLGKSLETWINAFSSGGGCCRKNLWMCKRRLCRLVLSLKPLFRFQQRTDQVFQNISWLLGRAWWPSFPWNLKETMLLSVDKVLVKAAVSIN